MFLVSNRKNQKYNIEQINMLSSSSCLWIVSVRTTAATTVATSTATEVATATTTKVIVIAVITTAWVYIAVTDPQTVVIITTAKGVTTIPWYVVTITTAASTSSIFPNSIDY